MTSLLQLRKLYEAERPDYVGFASHIECEVRNASSSRAIPIRTESRAKDPVSLMLKLASGSVKYDQIRDKAGVRVIVPAKRYVENCIDAILESVAGTKNIERGESQFDARMIVAKQRWVSKEMICEVQVVTESSMWWANLSHRYVYKAGRVGGYETCRAIERLRALAELVDIEVDRIDDVFRSESTEAERLGVELSHEWIALLGTGSGGNWSVTSRFLREMDQVGALQYPGSIERVRDYLAANRDRVIRFFEILAKYSTILAAQPEALWILTQMDEHSMYLEEIWPQWLGRDLFDELRLWWEASA